MEKVVIGLIGAGFASRLHCEAIKKVCGLEIVLRGVADLRRESAQNLADKYGFDYVSTDYAELLRDESIQAVIICTPPVTHKKIILDVLASGKHAICEKPLTGYFGDEGDVEPIGETVPKETMLQKVCEDIEVLKNAAAVSGKKIFLAENFIYAPSIQKAAEIITKQKDPLMFLHGEISTGKSPTFGAGHWSFIGGGTLIRIGCHPLGAVLYLKYVEGLARGEQIRVKSVMCEKGQLSPLVPDSDKKLIANHPVDVEDFASLTITFTDGMKALILSNDNVLGGLINYVKIYTPKSVIMCNTVPGNIMQTYFATDHDLEDIYISEHLVNKQGWNNVYISEMIERGYVAQLQDFMECVAFGREPLAPLEIGLDTVKTIYAAYVSAERGERVEVE